MDVVGICVNRRQWIKQLKQLVRVVGVSVEGVGSGQIIYGICYVYVGLCKSDQGICGNGWEWLE